MGMSENTVSFGSARVEAADGTLLEALVRRLALEPSEGPIFTPAHDVAGLRRVLTQLGPTQSPAPVIRLWQALSAEATAQRAGTLSVGLAGPQALRLWDHARALFGQAAALSQRPDAREVCNGVLDGSLAYGVLDWPDGVGAGAWWTVLGEQRFSKLRIVAGTPLVAGLPDRPEACVVSLDSPQPSGRDDSLILALDERHQAERALQVAGLNGLVRARARAYVLLRVEGYVGENGAALGALARAGLDGVRLAGSLPLL
jgi:hypothetical protein